MPGFMFLSMFMPSFMFLPNSVSMSSFMFMPNFAHLLSSSSLPNFMFTPSSVVASGEPPHLPRALLEHLGVHDGRD
eukprot:2028088-Alexandrium_andersonii.AAC.1